ncbi:MAG: DDE-type integrase/transposase/recombinase [Pyrinomonadaceae bacterium]
MRCLLIIWCYRTPAMITFETSAIDENLSPTFHRTNKRIRPHLKMSGTSYRVDETYIKVGKSCKYLYCAVDKEGQTIEFMLSAKRNVSAAKRFFKKLMRAEHRRLLFSILCR